MLAIEVEYLLGRCVATDTTQRDLAEWPPHPTRLFSALVDALADTKSDSHELADDCESTLRWLEAQPAPLIRASADDEVSSRSVVKHFVPINDESVGVAVRAAPIVEQRSRQERFFPAVVPADPIVAFAWPHAAPDERQWRALEALTSRIPYLGHSSSTVRVACRRTFDEATLVPSLDGTPLRVPGPGRLDRLVNVYTLRRKSTLAQPPRGREVRYAAPTSQLRRGPHTSARVFAVEGNRFGLAEFATIVTRFRAAILAHLGTSTSEALTGHAANGVSTTRPHIAFAALGNVGHRYANSDIKGLAIVLPASLEDDELLDLDSAASRVRDLHFGKRGTLRLRPFTEDSDSLESLRFSRYCKPAKRWVSVTPVVFGIHPKPKRGLTEELALLRDIAQLGLPTPARVIAQDVGYVLGTESARSFHRAGLKSVVGRVARHVAIEFPEKIIGPLLLGAGRHMGFGLLMPEHS